jgi:hypothetical protein
MPLRLVANANAQTTIALALTAGASSFVGGATANFTNPAALAGGVGRLTILDAGNPAYNAAAPFATPFEYADYTTNTVGTNTISGLTRGVGGTSARNFFAGAIVAQGLLVEDILASTPWKFDEQTPSGLTTVTIPSSGTIPASYLGVNWRNIRIVLEGRSTAAALNADVQLQFNGDTTPANYSWNQIIGNNSLASSTGAVGAIPIVARVPAATAPVGLSGSATIEIASFARTTFAKTLRATSMSFETGAVVNFYTLLRAANWNNTAAITSITLLMNAGNWAAGSIIHTYLEP